MKFYDAIANVVRELGQVFIFARWGHDELTLVEAAAAGTSAIALEKFTEPESRFPENTVVSLTLE